VTLFLFLLFLLGVGHARNQANDHSAQDPSPHQLERSMPGDGTGRQPLGQFVEGAFF
jgi:hypothetical protein